MPISNLEAKNMFVELLDDEAESISGGKISIKASELELSFKNLELDLDGIDIFAKKGFVFLEGVKISA